MLLGVVCLIAAVDAMLLLCVVDFTICTGFRVVWTGLGFAALVVVLAAVDVSNKLPPNNIRHRFAPNPTGVRAVVVVGFVLGLAVITTGALVVIIGAALDCIDAVLVSVYFFAFDVLNCPLADDVYGNKSITIGLEDELGGDKRSLIALKSVFTFEV